MKRKLCIVFIISATTLLLLMPNQVIAYEAWGWDEIRDDLIDGDGAEFIKPIPGLDPYAFSGATEMEAVLEAANFVAYHMVWVADPDPPGDVWIASDQQFAKITVGVENSGEGDCEDFAILLCALLRFHTQGGIPAERVWVQAGIITCPPALPPPYGAEPPPVFGHALVIYKAERRGIFYIEPQYGGYPYRGCFPSLGRMPYFAGESAMLLFNDEWVKGGGFWLAGPR
jgi:transglutaminase-like putative cysteine protease